MVVGCDAASPGAHVPSSMQRLSSAPASAVVSRLAGVYVTGGSRRTTAGSTAQAPAAAAAAAAAASRQRLRYATSAAVSRQQSWSRNAAAAAAAPEPSSPITALRGCRASRLCSSKLASVAGKTGPLRELRSTLQQQVAGAELAPPRRRLAALASPPQQHRPPTSRPLAPSTATASAATTRPSTHLAPRRSSLGSTSRAAKLKQTPAAGPTSSASTPRLPLYVQTRQINRQTPTRAAFLTSSQSTSRLSSAARPANNTRTNHLQLAASKFSLNSSTSSLTLASVKRARKAPSPEAAGAGGRAPRRASGSLAELSKYAHTASTGVPPQRSLLLAASSAALNHHRPAPAQRRPRSSHRQRDSLTTDNTLITRQTLGGAEPVPSIAQCAAEQQARPKSAASLETAATTATSCCHSSSVACGSARQSSGRASRDSGLGLFCCGESGDSLALVEKRLRYLQSCQQVEPLPDQQAAEGERRASFGPPRRPGGHIGFATMCSDGAGEPTPAAGSKISVAKSKPLALYQQQQQQTNTSPLQAANNRQQPLKQQAATANNNNFLLDAHLSHDMLDQELENRPPVNADQAHDDADKMSLGSPLVTPPPCELATAEPQPPNAQQDLHAATCRSLNRPPELPIRTNPITDLYDLETKPFARGKFAQVKRCVHRLSKQCFAAKCIKKRRRSLDTRNEILLEIEALKLCHFTQRIVKIFEVYETPSEMILVLELANGGELQRVLDEEERISEPKAQQMVAQILDGLIHLHDNDIAHLDIKPQNLLLTDVYPLGDIKLCDFGISRRITKDCEIRDICGTPDYVAPEILRYDPINLATDMWSLGVLTYILLSGYSPFGSDNKQQTFCNITQAELDFPSEIFDKISQDAIDFMKKLILREPSQRLTSRQARNHPWLATEKPS